MNGLATFLVVLVVVVQTATIAALLVDRFRSEGAHRAERERYVRALMSRTIPEFVAIERIAAAQTEPGRRNGRRLVPEDTSLVGQAGDPGVPAFPEGL